MKFRILSLALTTAVAVSLLSSCSSSKSNLAYFRDITAQTEIVPLPPVKPVRIAPEDELYITITSAEPTATAHFNLPAANPAAQKDMLIYQSPRQLTYIVNTKGNIDMPQIGTIHVAGMTIEELQADLTKKISQWVDDPTVTVRMVNYHVNVLGEVTRPGAIEVSTNRFSILDAIASAGDLTPYGERQNVLLIREENGNQKRVLLDLTSSELLTSEYYYLQPNDYIYVKPNKVKEGNAKYDSNKSYKLSMISTVVSASSVIASLVIALTVK
ncbi:MAG: polysaccharide export protein [Muribaculaceae bacterium]|nr:polysaccharide export protein [Muribaculaceae bacterium]